MSPDWQNFVAAMWQILSESAFWVVISLAVGGLVHEFLPSSRFQQRLNRKGPLALVGAVLFGALLPICSCGVIPLATSLYRAGVRLGPVMAFAAATPIINPAAVILSLALLGPQITLVYVALGLILPLLLGLVVQRWGDQPRPAPLSVTVNSCCSSQRDCCSPPAVTEVAPESAWQRIRKGLRWGLTDLGPSIAFYMGIGIVLAGVISAFLPPSWTDAYLRDNSLLALAAAGVLGASLYVCAVAHIPLVATLLAAGAAPGVAIVFLVTGTATNLPELLALYKTIGRRTVVLYAIALITGSMIAGGIVNAWLMPGFEPVFDPLASIDLLDAGERLQPTVGAVTSLVASLLMVGLMALGTWRRVVAWRGRATAGDEGCCSG